MTPPFPGGWRGEMKAAREIKYYDDPPRRVLPHRNTGEGDAMWEMLRSPTTVFGLAIVHPLLALCRLSTHSSTLDTQKQRAPLL